MPIPFLDLAIVLLAGAAVWRLGSAWLKYRGQRVITCPENHRPAGGVVNATHAAGTAFGKAPEFRLSEWSRWPGKAGCGPEWLRGNLESGAGFLGGRILAE